MNLLFLLEYPLVVIDQIVPLLLGLLYLVVLGLLPLLQVVQLLLKNTKIPKLLNLFFFGGGRGGWREEALWIGCEEEAGSKNSVVGESGSKLNPQE